MAKKSPIINGTSGDDALYGQNGTLLTGKGTDQTINGLGGNDILYGDSSIIGRNAHGGNDSLNGGDGNDTLYGDAYEMHQNSVGVTIGSMAGVEITRIISTATPSKWTAMLRAEMTP